MLLVFAAGVSYGEGLPMPSQETGVDGTYIYKSASPKRNDFQVRFYFHVHRG